jgi:hypothetical protein
MILSHSILKNTKKFAKLCIDLALRTLSFHNKNNSKNFACFAVQFPNSFIIPQALLNKTPIAYNDSLAFFHTFYPEAHVLKQ